MTVQPLDEEAIFHAARAMSSPAERANYLAEACGDNQALRARVEGLLKIYAEEKSFAGMPSAVLATIDHQPITEQPGTVIGPYKLMEQIGEGGFGLVFVAEQQQPVRRKVALKVIKPGMDTRDVIARFEAERQALALMDHPNIAQVFDAGATRLGPALLRHGTGPRRSDHGVLRPATPHAARAAGVVHLRSATPSSTRIKKGSSTATSSPPTCWSRCTTAGRSRR